MNYEDELERVRARRSRRRQNQDGVSAVRSSSFSHEGNYGESNFAAGAGQSRRMSRGEASESGTAGESSRGGRLESRVSRENGSSHEESSLGGRPRSRRNTSKETERWAGEAEPGSRASRLGGSSGGSGHNGFHRRKKPGNKKKKMIIRVLIGVAVVLAAAVFGVWAYIHFLFASANDHKIDNEKIENSINITQEVRDEIEKGYWTFAVFGVDSRDGTTGKGNQADVIMIVNVNRETGEIKLVSVFRDTYLNISEKNTYNKINAAYAQGGPEQAMMVLNKNLDLGITQYATFNWKAVATGINILGGIDVDISKSEFYYINAFITETVQGTGIGSVQLKSAGLNHLDGVQAVAYGRLRLMDTDYARTERQRLVIEKAFEKAKKADLATLNSLVGNMFALCSTNIDEMDVLKMVKNVNKYHMGETMGFPAARGEQKIKIGSRKADCVIPQTLESNVKSLHQFLYGTEDYTPSSTVQSISKKISEISGLYKEGTEIDHVPTDQGYIPKSTTAAPATEAETESVDELEQSSEGESSSGETDESSESESSSLNGPGDYYPGMFETDEEGNLILPTRPSGTGSTAPTVTEEFRPSSPADLATMHTTEGYGPGSDPTTAPASVPEATTSASGESQSLRPSESGSSIIIVPTTGVDSESSSTAVPTAPSSTGNPAATAPTTAPTSGAPVSPAAPTQSQNLLPGNTSGPASQATSGASEVPGAGM